MFRERFGRTSVTLLHLKCSDGLRWYRFPISVFAFSRYPRRFLHFRNVPGTSEMYRRPRRYISDVPTHVGGGVWGVEWEECQQAVRAELAGIVRGTLIKKPMAEEPQNH